MVSRFLLIALAFVLVATAAFASGEGEEAAAAEKEMVRDPATGKMVTAPEYGGTITFGTASEPPNSDPGQGHPGSQSWMFTLEKLGIADWALDRQRNALQSPYTPDFAITGLLAESWEQDRPGNADGPDPQRRALARQGTDEWPRAHRQGRGIQLAPLSGPGQWLHRSQPLRGAVGAGRRRRHRVGNGDRRPYGSSFG